MWKWIVKLEKWTADAERAATPWLSDVIGIALIVSAWGGLGVLHIPLEATQVFVGILLLRLPHSVWDKQ